MSVPSPATDAVIAAEHPSHDQGGPCDGCAFRPGTPANGSDYTQALARACVEGITPFHCHEHPHLCRGWVAAVNLNGAPDDSKWVEANRVFAELMNKAIYAARQEMARAKP